LNSAKSQKLNSTKSRKQTGARSASHRLAPSRRAAPKRRRRIGWLGRSILACAALILGLIVWAAIERALAPESNTTQDHFDVLIVLGSPVDADGNPTPHELARVTEAVHEYERGVAPRIIFTGGAVANHFVEAQVMARTAEAQGIPASAVLEDPAARNTMENTCNALRIMRSHGWNSAEVISSPSHLPRAALILSRLPIEWRVHAAPALGPVGSGKAAGQTAIEILKTVHYLIWSRQMERCDVRAE
jgi:uncharacterized SAM-binding protein YcdF (DUF218 family)